MTDPAIETHGLRKAYGSVVALDALDISVAAGEVFGFLGPNGAGKTTAVKLLLGLTRPSGGGGTVLGRPLGDRDARRRIGYLPELFRYQAWLTAREVLDLHASLAGLPSARRRPEVDRVLALVGLAGRDRDRTGGFSKGMQQRLGLAAALLGDPALVILDEPTSALDPVGRDDVRAIIREARDRGSAVLLNSHLLGEVERLCDRVAIVNRGRVIAAGSLAELLGEQAVRLRITGSSGGGPRGAGRVRLRVERRRGMARGPPGGPRAHPGPRGHRGGAPVAGSTPWILPGDRWKPSSWAWSGTARRLPPTRGPPHEPAPGRRHRRPHAPRDRPAADPVGAAGAVRGERRARRLGRRPPGRPGPRAGRRGARRSASASARS